ncbi:KPN_02809 family neutral zinc metallopeptidase [Rhodopila sp.]|jgi:predicted metalloprotease|uniref:KPN_02809 family neutral zinc metallopeptidase n=1 Tax=Rhodopila sp. TaxID=2480087 RepID=UPI002C9488D4|nr:neutral zinc metallopeptidase [Rhodopila sp.]HVZ08894.1 neutral zinc metallopeptidase [Rhodopila sp.]
MRDDDLRPSDNIEDRRGMGGGFGGGGFRMGRGGLGVGTIIGLGLLGWVLGINPLVLIEGAQMVAGGGQPQMTAPQGRTGAPVDQTGNFVARVLGETEDVWSEVLPAQTNRPYVPPKLVLFSGATQSACGTAQSATGPFYCPIDRKVYLDTAFFQDMKRRLGGGGDFAYAYVIAHEVGHHVQNLLGILPKVQAAQRAASNRTEANEYSVRTELMADCLAGVWAYWMNRRHANIDESDVRQAVATASAIGDDRLQRAAQGYVVPDSFTHGSAEQRVRWLTTGLKGGSVSACDTFRTQ